MSRNLVADLNPKTWNEIYGHTRAKNILQGYLRTNDHPPSIYITGDSGIGKGSLIGVYLKALFCHNRQAGEVDPCNNCPSCKLDPRDRGAAGNVAWVQAGRGDPDGDSKISVTKQLNGALAEAWSPPVGNIVVPAHRNYKVIVVDELQAVETNNLQNILFPVELTSLYEKNKVIWILVSMNHYKIHQKDSEIAAALYDRANPITLNRFTQDQVEHFVKTRFPEFSPEVAKLLAKFSDGRLRRVVRAIERIQKNYGEENVNTVTVSQELNYPSDSVRRFFWECMARGKYGPEYQEFKTVYKNICQNFDEHYFVKALLDDLDNTLCALTSPIPDILSLQVDLSNFLFASYPIDGWTVISQHRGKTLVDPSIFTEDSKNGIDLLLN